MVKKVNDPTYIRENLTDIDEYVVQVGTYLTTRKKVNPRFRDN